MTPGGVTELIWHFAGYLQLTEDVWKPVQLYDGSAPRVLSEDDQAARIADPGPLGVEDFAGVRLGLAEIPPFNDALLDGHLAHGHRDHLSSVGKMPTFSAPPKAIITPPAGGGGGGGSQSQLKTNLIYEPGGDDKILEIKQINFLSDNDILGDPGTGVTELHDINIPETLKSMLDSAQSQTPDDLVIPKGDAQHDLLDFIVARDDARVAENDTAPTIAPGHYVNGELQLETDGTSATTPTADESVPESRDGHIDSGLKAELGGNTSFNGAVIVDLNEASTSLFVRGNYFESNAIIQTNVLRDHDQVDVAGNTTAQNLITGENITDNIANFIETPLNIVGGWHTINWHVDLVEGDFFDIKTISQLNWLSDNDVTVQTTYSSYQAVSTGGNDQHNITTVFDLGKHYDIIVVLGDYHEANWIFQTNILLDDDIVKALSERGDTSSQSISTGENTLTNDATIDNVGGGDFKAMTPWANQLLDGLASHDLDASFAVQFPGFGPTLEVLYVTGNYYDINLISQINVIADVDTAIQYLPGYTGAGTTSTLDASTGSNELHNVAIIADVGTTSDSQFLGGEYYKDLMLVQANIVTGENDQVIHGDTQTLAPEVIAFIGSTDSNGELDRPIDPVKDTSVHDDGMGSVLT